MNPALVDAIGAIIRWALSGVFGYLVSQGAITNDQSSLIAAALATGIVTLGWSLWTNWRKRQKLVTALASPKPVSEKQVEQMIEQGQAPPATVPKTRPPHLEGEPNPMREGTHE
jgi:hypothetical protein